MTIFNSNGAVIYEAPITKDAIIKHTLMEDYYIEIPFEVTDIMPFGKGCYILYKGHKFEIMENVFAEPLTNKAGYKYILRFEAQQSHMKRCKLFWRGSSYNEVTFHNTTDLRSFGTLVCHNVNMFLGAFNWSVGSIPEDLEEQTKLISFNGDSCWDALNMIAETFEVEWWLVEDVVEYGVNVTLNFGKLELGTEEEFKAGDVVSSIPVRSGDDSDYGTRFYVFGSTRNLPESYSNIEQGGITNHVSEVRLRLPNNQEYIDAWEDLQPQDVVEQVVFFDDIFPKNTETATAISTVDREIIEDQKNKAWVMTCADTPFTPADMLEGEEFGCTFTSGSLMGRSFELSINTENFDKKFELIAQTEGDGDNIIIIPNASLHPEVGDTFILTGVNLPKARITEAENELLDKGTSWAVKKSRDTNIYDCPTNAVYCHKNDKNYELGQKVRLVGEQFGKDGRSSRIQGYEKKLYDEYQATYTVGDNTAYSRFGTIEKNIEQAAYAERIGVVSGVGIYVIRSKYDTTLPSDNNVYSALAAEALFLSKKKGGTVEGDTTFKKRVKIAESLTTEGFEEDALVGRGFGVTKDDDGNAVVTTDILKVRMKAEFNELVINQTTFERGRTVFSAAGCEITSVEVLDDVYRCYYDNNDGKRFSGFAAGDQARCQRYDESYNGITKMYWKVVKAVGDNYVDLFISGTDANGLPLSEGADAPEVGDNIVQFGNRTDKSRQSFIVIASTPDPTILQYVGVNSFTLPDPATKISPNDNEFTGKVHIGAGSTGVDNIEGLNDAIQEVVNQLDLDIDTDSLEFGKHNLLRNSGFRGDYLSSQLNGGNLLSNSSELFSPSLEHWSVVNAIAQESSIAESGAEVIITNGSMSQKLKNKIVVGDNYVLSFRAKGSRLRFSIAGVSKTIILTDEYTRYVEKFVATGTDNTFTIDNADCTLCELQLERGSVVSAWGYSMWDNHSELAYYQSLQYLSSALSQGSTTISGGLILTQMIMLGNYLNGVMKKNTAGVNGYYNDDSDVAFWAGGDIQKAIATVAKFQNDPRYQPTDAEWADMANFVATHGGDVFMRGYVYALGGLFRGAVSIANGKIQLNADGSGSLASGAYIWNKDGQVYRNFPDTTNWIMVDVIGASGTLDFSMGGFIETGNSISQKAREFTIPQPTFTPFTFWLRGVRYSQNIAIYPDETIYKDVFTDGSRIIYTTDNGDTMSGSAIKFKKTALASKGHIIVRWNGAQYVVENEGSLVVGNTDDCDVVIYIA